MAGNGKSSGRGGGREGTARRGKGAGDEAAQQNSAEKGALMTRQQPPANELAIEALVVLRCHGIVAILARRRAGPLRSCRPCPRPWRLLLRELSFSPS